MAKILTDEEMAALEKSKAKRFISDEEMAQIDSISPAISGIRGAVQGITGGYGDEMAGLIGGGIDYLQGEGDFKSLYEKNRDEQRKKNEFSDKANPKTYFGGQIAGGVVPTVMTAGTSLPALAASGAAQGLGYSEADLLKGEVGKAAVDTATGAGLGLAGGLALKGVSKAIGGAKTPTGQAVISKGKEVVTDAPGAIKASYEGFKSPTGIDGAVAGNFARIPKASTEFFKYFKEADINRKDITDIAGKLRQELPNAANLSDDQLFLQAMSEPGENSAKLFAANRVKASGGDEKAFLKLVNLSPEETAAARGFDKIEASNELADGVSKTYDAVKAEAGKVYDGLRNKARSSFTDQGSKPVQVVSDAITEAGKYKSISGSVRNSLDDVFSDIAGREGELPFTALEPAKQFDRILQARQRLDKDIKWASQNELAQGQKILADARMKLDSFLKPLDDMAAGDKAYSRFKNIERQLFDKLATKERGNIVGFEPTKIEDLLGGTKTSRKLTASLEAFKKQIAEGKLSPEAQARIAPFMKQLDDALGKAKIQRDLTGFRYQAGPTSPAVQQLGKRISAQSLTDVAGDSPQLFLKLRETIPDNAKAMFNDSFGNLSPAQKEAVTKFSAWRLNNLKASERQVNEVMQTFMKAKK